MEKYAIIVAGGSGKRMGVKLPKQFLLLHGKPVVWYSLTAFLQAFPAVHIILVLPPQYIDTGKVIAAATTCPNNIQLVTGGASRFHSVQNGLQHVSAGSIVFIHDAVRCLVTPALIRRCYDASLQYGNAIPAVVPVDSLRLITAAGSEVVDRSKVRIIQTPQVFYGDVLKTAYLQPYSTTFTDDASVMEKTGEPIHLIEGEAGNIKITRPVDLLIAEKILEEREKA